MNSKFNTRLSTRRSRWLGSAGALLFAVLASTSAAEEAGNGLPWQEMVRGAEEISATNQSGTFGNSNTVRKDIWRELFACDDPLDRVWSIEFGVGVITDNVPSDYFNGDFDRLHGPGGGVTYNITVTRRVHQFQWRIGSVVLRPEIEMPGRITLVDENTDRLIPDLNLAFALRWRDFPWNRFLRTTVAVGGGLSYSFQPWTADFQRHEEDKSRSRLKFWLPVEITVALPMFPQHQIVGFMDHQSGGTLMDDGGVDALGLGYRFEF